MKKKVISMRLSLKNVSMIYLALQSSIGVREFFTKFSAFSSKLLEFDRSVANSFIREKVNNRLNK